MDRAGPREPCVTCDDQGAGEVSGVAGDSGAERNITSERNEMFGWKCTGPSLRSAYASIPAQDDSKVVERERFILAVTEQSFLTPWRVR